MQWDLLLPQHQADLCKIMMCPSVLRSLKRALFPDSAVKMQWAAHVPWQISRHWDLQAPSCWVHLSFSWLVSARCGPKAHVDSTCNKLLLAILIAGECQGHVGMWIWGRCTMQEATASHVGWASWAAPGVSRQGRRDVWLWDSLESWRREILFSNP